MKYLKKFNEELKPDTYSNAARKLKRLGHTSRSKELEDWSYLSKWKDNVEKFSKFGIFDMDIYHIDTRDNLYNAISESKIFSGKFYLDIIFDPECYLDDEGSTTMYFQVGAIPVDKESYDVLSDACKTKKVDMYNGFIWANSVVINISTSEIKMEECEQDIRGFFSNRASAVRFKNLLKGLFDGTCGSYPSSQTDKDTMKELLMDTIVDEGGKSMEQFEEIITSISKINVNTIYKQ